MFHVEHSGFAFRPIDVPRGTFHQHEGSKTSASRQSSHLRVAKYLFWLARKRPSNHLAPLRQPSKDPSFARQQASLAAILRLAGHSVRVFWSQAASWVALFVAAGLAPWAQALSPTDQQSELNSISSSLILFTGLAGAALYLLQVDRSPWLKAILPRLENSLAELLAIGVCVSTLQVPAALGSYLALGEGSMMSPAELIRLDLHIALIAVLVGNLPTSPELKSGCFAGATWLIPALAGQAPLGLLGKIQSLLDPSTSLGAIRSSTATSGVGTNSAFLDLLSPWLPLVALALMILLTTSPRRPHAIRNPG